jgi:hypothetical protein
MVAATAYDGNRLNCIGASGGESIADLGLPDSD